MQKEKNLIERVQKNDPEAFAVIYEEHFDKIYRYVFLRVRNRMEAEDLTQQVFLNALKSISSYNWKGVPFSAWLFRIAHNQVIDYHRKTSKVHAFANELLLVSNNPDPAKIAEQAIELDQIKNAMGNLTDLQQEVISLRIINGFSTAETAKAMGKNEGAIKALQHSALKLLRKNLYTES